RHRPHASAGRVVSLSASRTMLGRWRAWMSGLSSFVLAYAAPRDLHAFPTRRSSDLRTRRPRVRLPDPRAARTRRAGRAARARLLDRKSTRLNSSHGSSSYAVFCLKKKNVEKVDQKPEGRFLD